MKYNSNLVLVRGKEVKEGSVQERLWALLDDIDTASDMFKPDDLDSYKKFYKYAMRKVELRHDYLTSDGYKLYEKRDGTGVSDE